MNTGIEPRTCYNTWQPEAYGPNSLPGREGIEGMFILQKIPHVIGSIPLTELKPKGKQSLMKSQTSIRKKYNSRFKPLIRAWWDRWFKVWLPPSETCPYIYLDQIRQHKERARFPLSTILYDKTKRVINVDWAITASSTTLVNPDFKWPQPIIAAMNCISSVLNPEPHAPRLLAQRDAVLIARLQNYGVRVEPYFDRPTTVSCLRDEIFYYCVDYDGVKTATSTMTKTLLLSYQKKWGKSFCSRFFRPLQTSSMSLVENTLSYQFENDTSASYEVASIDGFRVTRKEIKSFNLGRALSPVCINAVLALFRDRDSRILTSYAEVNPDDIVERPLKPSRFLSLDFMESLMNDPASIEIEKFFPQFDAHPFSHYNRVYCPYLKDSERQLYVIVILDVKLKKIFYVDPTIDKENPSREDTNFLAHLLPAFNRLSTALHYEEFDTWEQAVIFPYQYYDRTALENLDSSGTVIHMFTILFFLVKNVPIFFTEDLVRDIFRFIFCYGIMKKQLF
jgi:hypothetical protein